jgi:predicted SAM-dependent methyltransferase
VVYYLDKLEIGAGHSPRDGFIHLDIRPLPHIEVVSDCRKLPFEDNTFSEVYSSQVLEHLPRHDTQPALREWIRVVTPDGKIAIRVPNLRWALDHFTDEREHPGRGVLDILYGQQTDQYDFHYNGFTVGILTREMREAGLTDIEQLEDGFWIHLAGRVVK